MDIILKLSTDIPSFFGLVGVRFLLSANSIRDRELIVLDEFEIENIMHLNSVFILDCFDFKNIGIREVLPYDQLTV